MYGSLGTVAAPRTGVVVVDLAGTRATAGLMLAGGLAINAVPGDQGLPCPLRTLTGIPCPLCGMTTSVTAVLRGDVGDALAASPGGIVVVIVAVLVLAGAVGRRPLAVPSWSIPAGLAALWVFQLFRFGVL